MELERLQELYAENKLDDPLRNVRVTIGERSFEGIGGRLTVDKPGHPKLEIYFSGDSFDQGAGLLPGQIIPESHYAVLTAETHSGFRLEARKAFYSRAQGLDFSRVEFLPNEVVLRGPDHSPSRRAGLEGFISTFPEEVSNASYMVRDECPMFETGTSKSWLNLELENIRIGLRKTETGWPALKIWARTEGDPGVNEMGQTFLHALSFLLGRRLHWVTKCLSFNQEHTLILKSRAEDTARVHPPLPEVCGRLSSKHHFELLVQAISFFQTPESHAALEALRICWDSAGIFFMTRNLLLCTALEGLASYLIRIRNQGLARSPEETAFELCKKNVINLCIKNGLVTSPSEGCYEGDARLIRILKGIEASGWLHGAEKIKKAAESVGVTFTEDELKAWKKLRNKSAHGNFDFEDSEALQTMYWNAARVQGMLNKLVLGMIGFAGKVCDYSKPGFPTFDFP